MEINFQLISNFTIAMLAIVNPVEKIPLWVEASRDGENEFRWRLAALIILSCAAILLVFMLFGRQILDLLHVRLASFKIGGGLILIHFGFKMLKGDAVEVKKTDGAAAGSLKAKVLLRYQQVFIPVGVPVIAGPGAITTVIIYGSQSDSLLTTFFLFLALVAVLAGMFFTLVTGSAIQRGVGELPLKLTSRLFGIILIAIAVQFAIDGLGVNFPGWVSAGSP